MHKRRELFLHVNKSDLESFLEETTQSMEPEDLKSVSRSMLSVTKSPRNRFYESRFSRKQLLTTSAIPTTAQMVQVLLLFHPELPWLSLGF